MPSSHAILITGLLRCVEETASAIATLVDGQDLFIVTDSSQKKQLEILHRHLSGNVEVVYSDEVVPWAALEAALSHIERGSMIRQWLKLSLGRSIILQREQHTNHRYSCIYRVFPVSTYGTE